MTVGSLFAGIGGFDLGFERAGYDIRWQVEIDDYANRVLAKHWPHVRRYEDIRAIDWATVEPVDVVCGGFPCQPHSVAGRRKASEDDRDLWPEVVRCLREVRPRWFVGENVPGLLSSEDGRFFGTVLRDLAACGFDVEWDCLPASAFGAPHERDRVWIVAYPASCGRSEVLRGDIATRIEAPPGWSADALDPSRASTGWERGEGLGEPPFFRVNDGIPARVDRLRGLGNAIVPQIAEWLAHRIAAA